MPCENYKTFLGSECLLACFHNIVKYYNLDIEECDVFLYGDGLKTIYRKSTEDNPDITLAGNVYGSVFKFCGGDNKIKVLKRDNLSEAEAKNDMLDYLSQDMPVTVKVDPGYLKYSPIYVNGYGLTHYINIIDYNAENDSVLLSDGFIPTFPPSVYHNWYDYKIIQEGGSLKNHFYIIFDISGLKEDKLLQNKIKENGFLKLRANLAGYLNGYEDGNFAYGIKALRQFAEDVPLFLELLGNRFSEGMFKLNYNMKIHGLVSGKILLYKAFKRLKHNMNSDAERILADELMEMVNEWNKISLIVPINEISDQDDLFKLGMDSVSCIKLIVAIESEFGFAFDDEDLNMDNVKTINSIAGYIQDRTNHE